MTIHDIRNMIAGMSNGSTTRPIYLQRDVLKPLVAATRAIADDMRNNREIAETFCCLEECSNSTDSHITPHSSGVLLKLIDLAIAALPVAEPPSVAVAPKPIVEQSPKPAKTDKAPTI